MSEGDRDLEGVLDEVRDGRTETVEVGVLLEEIVAVFENETEGECVWLKEIVPEAVTDGDSELGGEREAVKDGEGLFEVDTEGE